MEIMKTPRSVSINITASCNLRCLYCSHFNSATDTENDLPYEEWLIFFKELKRLAVLEIRLSGGEPFLYKDFQKIVEGIVDNRMRYNINSNGTLITESIASFIASSKRCDFVQVSIDGSKPEVHDAFRGKGSFQKAVEGIHNLKKAGIKVMARVTIAKHNVMDLEAVAEFLLEELALPSFSTNSAGYLGLNQINTAKVELDPYERSLAMETLLRLNRKYANRISGTAGPLPEATSWLKMEEARREEKDKLPGGGALTACGCFWEYLEVRPDGVITPCNQMPHIELGRINQDDLMTIWQKHPELIKLRKRQYIPLSNFSECQECQYINYCTGNCPATAYNLVGDIYAPAPDACLKRFLSEGGRLPDVSAEMIS